jgi:predicted transcriptional regulator
MAMKKSTLPKPTEAELTLLRVLWRRGPSTVREVWEQAGRSQKTGYTTVLKIMQIMAEKGLVKRDETERSHVYEAAVTEDQTHRQVIGHLLDRVFSGSAHKLVMHALASKKATPAELAEIRKLLDEIERGSR